ncbi:MAG: TonB-dependent receptor [Bacteroidota bacterium]
MVKQILFTGLLGVLFLAAGAQNPEGYSQTIRGTIVDEDTKSPIIGANVVIVDSEPFLGASSDINGKFRLVNVPVGRHTISVSYLGYEPLVIPNTLVGSGKEVILNIELRESVADLDIVTVTAGAGNKAAALNEMATVSARSFSVEETKRFAAGASDPARMITAYPGASSNGGDDQNAIIIRGNSPRGLLWRLEGVEIPNPNHFALEGASSGGISILSTNTLAKSDFYTGAFPAEFGNALSGAFDIKLRNGNNEKREYTFQAGMLGIEAALEGPFVKGKNASYLVNYRYSTLSIFNALGINIVGEDDATTYQDAAFKFNFPTKNGGQVALYGIGGLSKDVFTPSGSTYSETQFSDLGVVGLSHLHRLSDKTYIKNSASFSITRIGYDAEDARVEFPYEYKENKIKSYTRLSSLLRTKFSARHILESGVTYTFNRYDFTEREIIPGAPPPFDDYEYLNEEGNAGMVQAYTSWKFRITDKLSFVNGAHLLYFGLNNKIVVEPRSALKWQFTPKQSISAGFGMHSRIESLEFYLGNLVLQDGSTVQPNRDLDFTKAMHYVIGYDNLFSKNWYFKAEAYYQHLYDVPVHHDPNNLFSTLLLEDSYTVDTLVNKGTGRNYGLELTLQRFFNKDFYLLIGASLYEATYKPLDGKRRNTPFASNFGLNFLAGKEFATGQKKRNLLGLNLRATWGGNKRHIPIDLAASQEAGEAIYDVNRAYEERLPDYWKIDLQVSYRLNKKSLTHEWRLDLLNLTNHQNVQSAYYNGRGQTIAYDRQTGFIPALSYRIEF